MAVHYSFMCLLAFFYIFTAYRHYQYEIKIKIFDNYNIEITQLVFITLCFTVAIYFVGTRPVDGHGDTWGYTNTFSYLTSFAESRYDGELMYGNRELFFWPFSYLFKALGFSKEGWLIVMLAIPILCLKFAFKKLIDDRYYLIIFLGLFFSYYLVFFCAIRQSLAEGFVMLSLVFAISKNIKTSLFFSFLAICFHQSAIISLVFPILVRLKLSKVVLISGAFIALLATTVASELLLSVFDAIGLNSVSDKMELYQSGGFSGEFDNLFYHKQFLVLFFTSVLYLYYKNKEDNLYNFTFYILFLIFFFWSSPVMSGRMMSYLTIIFPILIWQLLGEFMSQGKKVICFTFLFSLLGIAVISAESTQLVLGLY